MLGRAKAATGQTGSYSSNREPERFPPQAWGLVWALYVRWLTSTIVVHKQYGTKNIVELQFIEIKYYLKIKFPNK